MKAVDVMTRNVVSVKLDSSVFEAAQRMILNRISGLPVLDASGKLVGVVTEGDLLRRVETATERHRPSWLEFFLGQGRLATEYVRTHGRKVGDVMTPGPETIVEETPLDEIVTVMEQKRIKRLPVMRGDKMVGIVSRANLVQALATLARETADTLPSDAALRELVLAEIDKQSWSPGHLINVIARDGVVELWGTILDERKRQALRVVAENVPGTRQVKSSRSSRCPGWFSKRRIRSVKQIQSPADQNQLPMFAVQRLPSSRPFLSTRSCGWPIPMTYTKVMPARSKSATAT